MYNCKEKQNTNNNSGVPTGTIINFFGDTAPEGYLSCDGAEYAKSDYPQLANLLLNLTDHTPYEGSDANHFKVPDLRGEFLRGTGTNSHTNQGSGANVGEHQDATEIPNIVVNDGTSTGIYRDSDNTSWHDLIKNADKQHFQNPHFYANHQASIGKNNSSGYKNITARPTNTSVLYCIKY